MTKFIRINDKLGIWVRSDLISAVYQMSDGGPVHVDLSHAKIETFISDKSAKEIMELIMKGPQ